MCVARRTYAVSKSRIPAAMAAATVARACASSAAFSPRLEFTKAQPIIKLLTCPDQRRSLVDQTNEDAWLARTCENLTESGCPVTSSRPSPVTSRSPELASTQHMLVYDAVRRWAPIERSIASRIGTTRSLPRSHREQGGAPRACRRARVTRRRRARASAPSQRTDPPGLPCNNQVFECMYPG
eukprot:COSAG02_NODE_19180_length_896_cov_0.958595_1_plen_183_part_00